jgi:hypothetical protein
MGTQALSGVERDGGRFRSFLLKSLENFLTNEWRHGQAQKRGGGQRPLSLNAEEGEARFALGRMERHPNPLSRNAGRSRYLEHVTERLREEHAQAKKDELFERLRGCLQGDRSGPAYSTLAAQCGMSEGDQSRSASYETALR